MGPALRTVGWGPVRLPGERNRWRRAEALAREWLSAAEGALTEISVVNTTNETIEDFEAALTDAATGSRRFIIAAMTGSGKTHGLTSALSAKGERKIYIAPSTSESAFKSGSKVEIYRALGGKYAVRLKSKGGSTLAHSKVYPTKSAALRAMTELFRSQ